MNESQKQKDPISLKFARWIVDRPLQALFTFAVLLIIVVPAVTKIKSSYTPKVWFDPDHKSIQALNVFEKRFGNDQNIVIGLHNPDGIFKKDVLNEIQRITDEMWLVTDVIRVESLSNYNYIFSEGDDIIIDPFLHEDLDYSPKGLALLEKRAMADEIIPDFYVSPDGTYALILGYMRPYFQDEPDFSKVISDVRKITKKSKENLPNSEIYIIGDAAGNDAFREISAGDNKALIPFMVIFINILLFLTFRSWWSIILTLGLIGSTVALTFGAMGWLGLLMTSLLSAIPGVLLAICIADSVHILTSYFHFRTEGLMSKESILKSLTKNFQPTLLTSVSTAISFFSITKTEIAPVRNLGLLCGIGTITAWLFTFIMLGAMFSLLSNRLDKYEVKSFTLFDKFGKRFAKGENGKNALSIAFVKFITRNTNKIIVAFCALTAISFVVAMNNEVNSDPIKYFHKSVPVRQAYDFSNTKLDGLRGIELVVDSEIDEGVKNPEFLRKLDKYIEWLKSVPEVTKVKSVMEVIKKMNKVLHEGQEKYYTIPKTQKEVAEILFLYTVGLPQGMDLNNQITLDNRRMRMRVVWKVETSKETKETSDFIVAKAKDFGLNVEASGNVPIYSQMNTLVVTSFFTSMAMALCLVGLLLLFVFKDVSISLLSMLPNVIPLIFGGAIMALMGKYIDIGTSLVYTVCLGIAVDDTIHFVASYKNNRNLGLSPNDAILETFQITGKALVITTVLLVVGFGSFVFADFVPNRNFGILCSIILLLALLTDLLFLPALLLKLDKGNEADKKAQIS